jgi:Flp pilus assembly protein TadD
LAAVAFGAGAAWFLRPSAPVPETPRWTGKREGPLIPVATPAHREPATEDPGIERGEELLDRGQYREAIAELKLAVSRSPQSAAAYVALGNAYLEADQPGFAVEPLQTAVKLEETNARAHLLLGTAWQSLGKNRDAAKAYRRYLELDPGGEYAHDVRLILENLLHSG